MTTKHRTGRQDGRVVAGVILLLCAANLAFAWPGMLTPDSRRQLAQALAGRYDDWHPPFMAMLWRLAGPRPATMLLLQVGLHWLGIWTFAEGVRRVRASAWVWAVVAVGLTPIALRYTGVIQKDSLLASLFLLAFGLSFLLSRALALPVGIAAILVRANGAFALPPLLLGTRHGTWRTAALSLVAAVALVPLVGAFNTQVLGARATGVQRSVQLFDLAGIARVSGDTTVLPDGAKDAVRCYTPLFWDALDRCTVPLGAMKPSLTREWAGAIARHPLAYARHRLAHFNRTIFFVVPPMQQCVDAPAYHRCDFSARGYVRDAIEKNALLWPVTWFAAGLALLAGTLAPMPRALILSGLLYGAAYAVVGVAADFRYFYWTELAIQLAIVLQLALVGRVDRWKWGVAAVGIVWAIGYAARVLLA